MLGGAFGSTAFVLLIDFRRHDSGAIAGHDAVDVSIPGFLTNDPVCSTGFLSTT